MSADNKSSRKDEGSGRKTPSARPQEPSLKCPRCDSPNTKFCYYNNYCLTQPRHFCKTCRRYWTKGGALRNVPIGGGCRKSKKIKSFSNSRLSGDPIGSSDLAGLKYFHGISQPGVAVDFQLNFPRMDCLNNGLYSQFSSFGDLPNTCASTAIAVPNPCFNTLDPNSGSSPLMGFNNNFPLPSSSLTVHSIVATSIESLSSINQDLHWKLQQQRMAALFAEENQKENCTTVTSANLESQVQKPESALLFQSLEIPKQDGSSSRKEGTVSNLSTEWFFDNNSYALAATPIIPSNANENTTANWNGIQPPPSWSSLQNQFSALP